MSAPARLGAARRALAERLRQAGLASPALDARLLVAEACGRPPERVLIEDDAALEADAAARLEDLAARRLAGEPVARILGRREFWSLDVRLGPDALVPRPETETLVAAALAWLVEARARPPVRVADLGTGSGCALLALLSERADAFGVGLDISEGAARLARDNAHANGLGARAAFLVGDWAGALAGPFDAIVSNPPYVRRGEIAGLAPEVAAFDPVRALDGGEDGLDAYRALVPRAARALAPGGRLFLEIGAGQDAAVAALLEAAGLGAVGVDRDLAGHVRVVSATKKCGTCEKSLGNGRQAGYLWAQSESSA